MGSTRPRTSADRARHPPRPKPSDALRAPGPDQRPPDAAAGYADAQPGVAGPDGPRREPDPVRPRPGRRHHPPPRGARRSARTDPHARLRFLPRRRPRASRARPRQRGPHRGRTDLAREPPDDHDRGARARAAVPALRLRVGRDRGRRGARSRDRRPARAGLRARGPRHRGAHPRTGRTGRAGLCGGGVDRMEARSAPMCGAVSAA